MRALVLAALLAGGCALIVGDPEPDGACTAGAIDCATADTPRRCVDGAWRTEPACGGATPICAAGACVDRCIDGTLDCVGDRPRRCAMGAFVEEAACGAGACVAGTCTTSSTDGGTVDFATPSCAPVMIGATSATALAAAVGLCDPQILTSTSFAGPSDTRARAVVGSFGVIAPPAGSTMVLLSTGIAADKQSSSYAPPRNGTDLGNQIANPIPTARFCSMASMSATVHDATEWVLALKVPPGAHALSFRFQFFGTDYPAFVCSEFNDLFVAIAESPLRATANVCVDGNGEAISASSPLLTVCANGTTAQTMHCAQPVTGLDGTGYSDDDGTGHAGGGSTGWRTTSLPVTPGEALTLRLILFDVGDGILDSAVLLDDFRWSSDALAAPTTL